jgi:23S rRNA (guanine745-N1)-methyltransferase
MNADDVHLGYTRRMLLCPVRECRLPLVRDGQRLACERKHSFDIARSGYINLLQPQDRRSKNPGDSAEAVAARRRLHDLGVTKPLREAIAGLLDVGRGDVVLDAGCGDGFYLGSLVEPCGCEGHGIDISVPAIQAAARRYPGCEWTVGNADRFIPYTSGAFSAMMSITARQNVGEFRRLLRENGRLLVAVPAPDDLIELRGTGRDRTARTIAEFGSAFELAAQTRATATVSLDEAAVRDVLLAIYRPLRRRVSAASRVTFSLDLLLFRPRGGAAKGSPF